MKAFIIHLPEREHSIQYAEQMHKQLVSFGLDAHLHVGTNAEQAAANVAKDKRILYPFSIKNKEITNKELKSFIRPEL